MNGPDFAKHLQGLANPVLPVDKKLNEEQLRQAKSLLELDTRPVTLRLPRLMWRFLRGPHGVYSDTEVQNIIEESILRHLLQENGVRNLAFLYGALVLAGEELVAEMYKTQGASYEQDTTSATNRAHSTGT